MHSISKILVAVDFSPNSARALDAAIEYASKFGAQIELVHAFESPLPAVYFPGVSSPETAFLGDARNAPVNGYDARFTNAVRRDLTKGSASDASAIFFGNFADYYIGYWGGISLEMVRDKTNAISGLYTLVASSYYDGGVVRPKSFAAMLDALGA